MADIEIEIQVNIENSKPLIGFLEKNADFKEESHQIDEYFSPTYRNFIEVRPVKEWLRLRDSGDQGESCTRQNGIYLSGTKERCE